MATVRGFIVSSLSLVGWIASIALTYRFAPDLKTVLSHYLKSEPVLVIASYSSLLLFFLILFAIVNSMVGSFIGTIKGGFFDRLMGALFGLFRGFLITSFLFMSINMSVFFFTASEDSNTDKDEAVPQDIRKAQLYNLLQIGNNILLEFMPNELEKRLRSATASIANGKDKFINQMIEKIYQQLDSDEMDEVDKQINDDDTQTTKAHTLIDYYSAKHPDQTNISQTDISKLKKILSEQSK
jgi:membrane protein required for colicin V production